MVTTEYGEFVKDLSPQQLQELGLTVATRLSEAEKYIIDHESTLLNPQFESEAHRRGVWYRPVDDFLHIGYVREITFKGDNESPPRPCRYEAPLVQATPPNMFFCGNCSILIEFRNMIEEYETSKK